MSTGPYASLNLAAHVGDDPGAVARNRAIAAGLLGLGAGELAVLDAEHGARVAVAERPGQLPPADAVVTAAPGIGLVALAADCVPLALAAVEGAPCVAAVHCGWRGLAAGVVPAAVGAMRAMGATAIRAVLGPSVCARCYGVPQARIEELAAAVDPAVLAAATALPGTIGVAEGVLAQLGALGVAAETVPGCTAEDGRCFSHRRSGGAATGRQGMIVRL